jgi:hypothetical protein
MRLDPRTPYFYGANMKSLFRQFLKLKTRIRKLVYWKILPKYDLARTNRLIRKLSAKKRTAGSPIKVGYIVQVPAFWNKQAPVYEQMTRDPRFDPWLIVVPTYGEITRSWEAYGAELSYFQKLYPSAQILTSAELSENFRGLKKQGFDYVFFQRCWEAYLPRGLRTRRVLRWAKTCYIPYAFHCFKPYSTYYETRFFTSLSLLFCCSQSQSLSYPASGRRKAVFLGYPSLDGLRARPTGNRRLRLLWTPRWSDNARYGGTTFFAYKDRFFELAERFPELEILFRPHPLTFENAVLTGQMTPESVEAYQRRCIESGIRFDDNASIDDTLPTIDVLLSDFSSILVDAAVMGKAIVYCGGRAEAEPDETMARILQCVYPADSWEDAAELLVRLIRGEDPKREARNTLSAQLAAEHKNSTAAILQYLADDAGGAGKQ